MPVVGMLLIIALCLAGMAGGVYMVHAFVKNGPLVHIDPHGYFAYFLGTGIVLRVKLAIIGGVWTVAWCFVLYGVLLSGRF